MSRSNPCDSLVNIGSGPVEELAGHGVETCCGVLEIRCFPNEAGISPCCIHSRVAVVTIVVASKSDIVGVDIISFNYDLQCGVVRPAYKY